MMHKVFLGCDHGGFEAKEEVLEVLESMSSYYEDLGAFEFDKDDDYPDIVKKVSNKVLENKNSFGILICGSGVGVAMAANKIKGIRAVQGYDKYSAKYSRLHQDANILTLRAREFDHKKYNEIIRTFLETHFTEEIRHKKRMDKMEELKEEF